MKRIEFYKLSNKEKAEVFKKGMEQKLTYNDMYKIYKEPDWCNYPDALCGKMGCYTLIGWGHETKIDFKKNKCKNCDQSDFYIKDK